jgi:hypothetical protein
MSWSCRRVRRAPVAAVTVLVVLLVLLEAGCHSSSSVERLPRPQDPPKTDPSARAAFLDAVTRGSTSTWWVESTFARTTGAKTLRSDITEVSRPPDHVVVGVGGATGVLRGHPLSCTPATGGPLCADGTTAGTVTDVAALARLTDAAGGWYALRPAPSRRVAGLASRCFRMDWNYRGMSQPFGTRATLCYSDDGVPVALDVVRPAATDSIVARSVRRAVTDAAIDALIAPYANAGPVRPLSPGTSVAPAVPPIGP